MAAVAAGIGAAGAAEVGAEALAKVLDIANTEIVGYHKTTYKYDSKGLLKESHTWNASLKAWELAALLLAGVIWEGTVIVGDAVKGTTEMAVKLFDPVQQWVQEALVLIGEGKKVNPPPSQTAGQALNAQLSLFIHSVGQVVDPLLVPATSQLAKKVQEAVNKQL